MSDKIEFELYDITVKNFKTRDGFGLYGDIPIRFAAQAAELLIQSQGRGKKLVVTARIVDSEPGDLQ